MRDNQPVTQREYDYASSEMLVSTTNPQGVITHCNEAFSHVSGYASEELLGQAHNLIRHPDMPAEAFKDMWATIGRGKSWSGVVKNRRKNGDHYWVMAHVTPLLENGKPRGYMSVRTKPTAAQVQAAQQLYARMGQERAQARHTFRLQEGQVLPLGWRLPFVRFWRAGVTARLSLGLGLMVFIAMLPHMLGMAWAGNAWAQLGFLALGAAIVLRWFDKRINRKLRDAERFASELAACNLGTSIDDDPYTPLGSLPVRLRQIQINLAAVVGDVLGQIDVFSQAVDEIARGSGNLSERTETQASNLQQTSSTLDALAGTVEQSAQTAVQVFDSSAHCTQVAQQGGQVIESATRAMQEITTSSRKMGEIIGAIEGIAFQTNILALNAAVEAARAGEHGRGFAVVASEVRSLAQRAGGAAKEIRELIQSSAIRVEQGAREMDMASRTVHEVVREVGQMNALVKNITDASQEQSRGIGQINAAVSQVEAMTQQNAALAEESAAAVETLRAGTLGVRRSVSVFALVR